MKLYRTDPRPLRARRDRRRLAARVRDGGRVDGGRGAAQGGQEPHARVAVAGARHVHARPATRSCCPGSPSRPRASDHFPIEQMLLQRWQNGSLEVVRRALGLPASEARRCRPVGPHRSTMLRPPARGDRPATTRHRWQHLVSEILTRPSPTSWPRRGRCAAGALVTYSPKVFIPLTTLCRDVCGYCTFARPPRRGERAYLPVDEVLEIARAGAAAGCTEALFTLGDKPELRYRVARDELARARLRDDDRVPGALRRAACSTRRGCCRT